MKFSFRETIKKITNKSRVENTKDNLQILKENTIYAQKMMKFGIWTYFVEEDRVSISDEIFSIYESKFEKSFNGFKLYYHPDDKDEVVKNIKELLKGKSYDIGFRIITKEGKIKFIREKISLIHNENDEIIKVIGVIQDVTNQKLLAEELIAIDNELYNNGLIEGVGNWKYDVVKNKYYLSEEVYNMHDIEPQEFRNDYKNVLKNVHKDDKLKLKELVKKAKKGKQIKTDYRLYIKDNYMRYLQITSNTVFNLDGKAVVIYGSIKDITKRKELNIKLRNKEIEIHNIEEGYQNIIRESKDGFTILNSDGLIIFISDSVEKIISYSRKKILNTPLVDLFEGEVVEVIKEMINSALESPKQTIESDVEFINKEGKKIYLETFMRNMLDDPSLKGIVFNFRDITQKKEMERQMIYDANHDKLTGLKNRDYFLKELNIIEKETESLGFKYAFMMIDIDDLKHIDLSLGHDVRDKLVVEIVNRLKTIISDHQYISRYSEDQFAIIAKDGINEESYQQLAEKIIEIISIPFKINSYEFSIAINIGICVFPKNKQDRLPLRDSVKIALLRSKKIGKNTYKFYSSELNIKYYKEFTLTNDLKDAIENEQLELYYQPVVNLKDNLIIGAEALIRWNHPEWGIVPPGEFISIAEETGLIIEIGKWIVEEVFKNYKRWIDKGLPAIEIGVNFSAIQFFEKDFTKKIKKIIEKFDFNPEFLIMEITENILLKNREKVNEDIQALRSIGIKMALDDFGTGYSSLSYLHSLNIDILKIDRSFIKDIPSDVVATAITSSTVKLAKELKLEIISEGIENQGQLDYLKSINCTEGQGFLYSKPVPLKEFENLLAQRKCRPIVPSIYAADSEKDRRKFFRIKFVDLLEADMTILKMAGKKIDIGNTKVLIKDIGPGGLCFISNIRFPIEEDLVLKFTTNLVEEEIAVYGNPVWTEEIDTLNEENEKKLYRYGIEFRIAENDRVNLVKILNEVQIKMRNNILFAEGQFIDTSYNKYFE